MLSAAKLGGDEEEGKGLASNVGGYGEGLLKARAAHQGRSSLWARASPALLPLKRCHRSRMPTPARPGRPASVLQHCHGFEAKGPARA